MRAFLECARRRRITYAEGECCTLFPHVIFTSLGGDEIQFEQPAQAFDCVTDVRQSIALKLDVHVSEVKLYYGSVELMDGLLMHQALRGASGVATVAVVKQKQPCQAHPDAYQAHIKRDVIAFLEVDRIRFDFGHPLDYVEEEVQGGWSLFGGRTPPKLIAVPRVIHTTPHMEFPLAAGININMMPFIMGEPNSVPHAYRQYWPLIEACNLTGSEKLKVGYLTIQESLLLVGESQRRGGLHIDSPGAQLSQGGNYEANRVDWGCGIVRGDFSEVRGGIYMASTVPNSCRVWNVQVADPVVGELGDMEHLRDALGEGTMMEANKLYWLTDSTPHESLPLSKETYRQYFRLVTSSLTAWYPEHSTANPLGVVPDSEVTRIVHGNKFFTE
eukprot:TRINITY_DN51692_c0_g1_i1.p1 TRINITY_DN51692_c0_g1~~TRINITY_DN51692_c0_g1_i1.p1  ORF type:complete len:387 (+),score=29.10 TRINITY_DN51692_c0_g1_i1:50-1210(+)